MYGFWRSTAEIVWFVKGDKTFDIQLLFLYSYHGYNACNNLFYTQSNEIVFHTAALGIVYSPKTHEQRFYNGHDDDILCLTVHDDQDFIATGQVNLVSCNVSWSPIH